MRSRSLAGWVFAGPALIMLGLFFFVPVLLAFALSLTNFDLYSLADFGNTRFVGFANYAELVRTPLFWKALGNTFYFVIVGVPLSIAVSNTASMLPQAPIASGAAELALSQCSCSTGSSNPPSDAQASWDTPVCAWRSPKKNLWPWKVSAALAAEEQMLAKRTAGQIEPGERAQLQRDVDALFAEHEARVYAQCYRRVRDEQRARELAQDVLLAAEAA